jgi:hypothetical protein
MDNHMFFQGMTEKLAQKLQKLAMCFCALAMFLFSQGDLFANGWDTPVVLLNDPLVPAIELQHGRISEVVVEKDSKYAFQSQNLENEQTIDFSSNAGIKTISHFIGSDCGQILLGAEGSEAMDLTIPVAFGRGTNEREHEDHSVKSIANSGLVVFLGICLNRSELPSKNSSTLCANFPPRSMTQKFVSVWKSSWQQVKTTSLWLSSTNSYKIQRTSSLNPFTNLIPNTSDILSTWSNEMAVSLPTSSETMRTQLEQNQGFEVQRRPKQNRHLPMAQSLKNQAHPSQSLKSL